jgi:hypothetical protein
MRTNSPDRFGAPGRQLSASPGLDVVLRNRAVEQFLAVGDILDN